MTNSEKLTLSGIVMLLITVVIHSIYSYKLTVSETLTLVGIAATAIIGVINLFISNGLNRRLKAYEIWIEEVHELNVKMHDRLVDVEDAINSDRRPSDDVRKRLLYNASRLYKYDETIIDDVQLLINNWSEMFSHIDSGSINSDELSKSKSDILGLVKNLKLKVDEVQKRLYK